MNRLIASGSWTLRSYSKCRSSMPVFGLASTTQPPKPEKRTTYRDWKFERDKKRGYWGDHMELNRNQGNMMAPLERVILAKRAQDLPISMVGLHLDASGRVGDAQVAVKALCQRRTLSLLTIAFTSYGVTMNRPWIAAFEAHLETTHSHDQGQVVQLSVMERFFTRVLFKPMLLYCLRNENRGHPNRETVAVFEDIVDELLEIGVENRMAGYVFLVDGEGKIRWRASAPYLESHCAALSSCIDSLLAECSL